MATPLVQAFLDELQALVDRKDWPALDRDGLRAVDGRHATRIVLAHRSDHALDVALEIDDRKVVVNYDIEHQDFTKRDEALRFIEMLGDGRVRLVVKRSLVWNSIRSYRDDVALPFAKTSEPWLNLRPRVEELSFGFA